MTWRFPHDVPGWLSEAEGRALAGLASCQVVLEVGSYQGRSTICMAQTADHVMSVDHHQGDAGSGDGGTLDALQGNLVAYGVRDKVTCCVEDSAGFRDRRRFGLAFIDGAHDYDSVCTDLRVALAHLADGGRIAMHDWNYPDVRRAVMDVVGSVSVETADNLAWFTPQRRERPKVVLAMPRHHYAEFDAVVRFLREATLGDCDLVCEAAQKNSILDECFNVLWCQALNARRHGATHFAMQHADVVPEAGWLDILAAELQRLSADVVSAVVPIKSPHGLTSTAVDEGSLWRPRRLTMREIYDLPETFSAADVGKPLLVNTGLWMCDLRKDWCERLCFDSQKRIIRGPDGDFYTESISEDWLASRFWNDHGAAVYATRKVKLAHVGPCDYPNDRPWGRFATDELNAPVGAAET